MITMRNLLFTIIFYGGSVPIVLTSAISALFGWKAMVAHTHFWTRFHGWTTRHILGIDRRIEGQCFADGPVIYAAKHQAMYETLELGRMLHNPAIVMKQELTDIPVWGWAAKRYGVIVVDREASAGALRRMLREARVALAAGRSILIFPEGTRVTPGEQPELKAGFAGLYQMLRIPVVPIAIDSGLVWPRQGPHLPGTVTFRFGTPIPPGLPRAEAEARVHAAINALERHQAIAPRG
ncbi:1-acyl-sn-glycerol-3-phosphate acyltransferase [Sphingomonas sp. TREG-RG-20F-R18-01]|uniref:lysophospholipid acyltransferase family protein n=1 Tax=Sphingomonas sp. TREG-RG-20F-R18-01 TaxID=2914982 RepID=UPI001F583D85|nr:1-acyl-sn-glycerol-3-phosphate acyltransferase [Sphingomonas sp. TREG-RG-20F-R18-01]